MIETVAIHENRVADPISQDDNSNHPIESDMQDREAIHVPVQGRIQTFIQILRFALAGGLNTLVDLLILNGLLWLFPTSSSSMLLA